MLLKLFELLNHLNKRPVQLGKGIKKATRAYRPLNKGLKQKKCFFVGANCLPKPQEKCHKGILCEKAWPDVACQEKSSKNR